MNKVEALILDTETTGFNDPALIEVASAELVLSPTLDIVGDIFEQRYNPGKPCEIEAVATHHILDEELVDCPPSSSYVFPDAQYVVGHNVDFDCVSARVPATTKRICTLALARSLHPHLGKHTQTALAYHYLNHREARELVKNAHSARQDIFICSIVLRHMWQDMGCPPTWERMWELSEEARLPKVMSFGKHKGTAVDRVPMDYRFWYARQDNPDPYLLKAWKL